MFGLNDKIDKMRLDPDFNIKSEEEELKDFKEDMYSPILDDNSKPEYIRYFPAILIGLAIGFFIAMVISTPAFAAKFVYDEKGVGQEIKTGGVTHVYGSDGSRKTEIDTDYRYDVRNNSW